MFEIFNEFPYKPFTVHEIKQILEERKIYINEQSIYSNLRSLEKLRGFKKNKEVFIYAKREGDINKILSECNQEQFHKDRVVTETNKRPGPLQRRWIRTIYRLFDK